MFSKIFLSDRRRTYVRLMGNVRAALNAALIEENALRNLTKSEMATALGKNKSFITRHLSGVGNMTLETLADLAFSLNRPVEISLPSRNISKMSNSHLSLVSSGLEVSNSILPSGHTVSVSPM